MPEPDVLPRNQHGGISVSIDGVTCFAPHRQMSGAELRALPDQPIGKDRDLWQEVDGGLDQVIQPGDKVDLAPQMRFFTVPRVINPGRPR
jgi:Multiubiquitin